MIAMGASMAKAQPNPPEGPTCDLGMTPASCLPVSVLISASPLSTTTSKPLDMRGGVQSKVIGGKLDFFNQNQTFKEPVPSASISVP